MVTILAKAAARLDLAKQIIYIYYMLLVSLGGTRFPFSRSRGFHKLNKDKRKRKHKQDTGAPCYRTLEV